MTSAESIVKHYLERGYSLESLRLLAESREQPLALDMLAVISRLEGSAEAMASMEDSGPCETAAYAVAAGDEDMVFFVADDDAEVSEACGIDFDVMAETASEANGEESIAEVLVGGDDSAELAAVSAPGTASEAVPEPVPEPTPEAAPGGATAGLDECDQRGVWSRLWTRVATAATADIPLGQPPENETVAVAEDAPVQEPVPAEDPQAGTESAPEAEAMAEISASEALCEAVRHHPEPEAEAVAEPEQAVSEELIAEEQAEEFMDEQAQECPEVTNTDAQEDEAGTGDETPDVHDEVAAHSEITSDYLPGSVSMVYDDVAASARERIEAEKRRLVEAQQAVASSVDEPQPEVRDEPESVEPSESAAEAGLPEEAGAADDEPGGEMAEPEAVAENESVHAEASEAALQQEEPEAAPPEAAVLVPAPVAEGMTEAKKSARRERRRERARKRKEKRNALKDAADLPEIVLARSEGTETLSLAEDDALQNDDVPTAGDETLFPALAEEAQAEADDAGTHEPCMSEPMSLITPNDVIEDDSGILADAAAALPEAEEGVAALAALITLAADAPEREEVADTFAAGDDHLMIIANGGVVTDMEDEADEREDAEEATGNNVILFSEKFPEYAENADDEEEFDAGMTSMQCLRMLPPLAESPDAQEECAGEEVSADVAAESTAEPMAEPMAGPMAGPMAETMAEAVAQAEPPVPMGDYLTEATRLDLLRLVCGRPEPEEGDAVCEAADIDEHSLVVSLEPDPTVTEILEREAAIRNEMEAEYQTKLDGFAARLLDVQAAAAASENLVREKQGELDASVGELEALQARLAKAEAEEKELLAQVEAVQSEVAKRDEQLALFKGMRDEHKRLYDEFEDLRRAYNEVTGEVMPGLQQERDDLALTVERQCEEEKTMRSSLGSLRKRLAVGYSLGAAAAVTLIALPVMNWMNSSSRERELALQHQQTSELRENLQREVQESIDKQNRIIELENKVKMASAQINQLQSKNQELVRVQQDSRGNAGLAVFRPTESGPTGTPTRASTMALQASPQPGARLHVNEVRDPAGSIEQVLADNRARQGDGDTRMANGGGGLSLPIPLTSVARTETRDAAPANSLRPAAAESRSARPARQAAGAGAAGRTSANKPVAREGEVLATVKAGEGVAQVVYRQLGTWDPEVVSWVIRENKIRTDRRGNPVIHPNQVLRLPQDGRVGQSASAARRR
ncbi:MAG: hypothetical protein LUE17_01790 [Planctomycetaceae bacterium]|nr:hypothetical protein [Planctomycetaceae bacterium]